MIYLIQTSEVGHTVSGQGLRVFHISRLWSVFLYSLRQVFDVVYAAVLLHPPHGLLDHLVRDAAHVLLPQP